MKQSRKGLQYVVLRTTSLIGQSVGLDTAFFVRKMQERLTSEVAIGDFLRFDSGEQYHFGEVIDEDIDGVTVKWGDGLKESYRRDVLDSGAYSTVDDQEVPPPEGFLEHLKMFHDFKGEE